MNRLLSLVYRNRARHQRRECQTLFERRLAVEHLLLQAQQRVAMFRKRRELLDCSIDSISLATRSLAIRYRRQLGSFQLRAERECDARETERTRLALDASTVREHMAWNQAKAADLQRALRIRESSRRRALREARNLEEQQSTRGGGRR